MKTWNNYKDYVKSIDSITGKDLSDIEEQSAIISTIIQTRIELGMSQRDLASICNIPQSSIARIEGQKITPKLDTLIKIMRPLGLKLTVSK